MELNIKLYEFGELIMGELFSKQIKALSGSIQNKLRILNYLSKQVNGATSREIQKSALPKSKDATFYNYLNQLKTAELIVRKYNAGEYRYHLTGKELSKYFKKQLPKVRTSVEQKSIPWDSNAIINSLLEILIESAEELKLDEIVKEVEHLMKYSNFNTISKATIRYLLSEILFNKGFEKESYLFLPVGFPVETIKRYAERENPMGLHKNFIGERFRKQYFIRYIPYNLHTYFQQRPNVHFHAVENLLYPLNILHDIRWIFLGGINVRNHKSSAPKHLQSALSQTLALLGFSSHDYVRTQGINHFNYYIAPYAKELNKKQLQNQFDGFIKQLYREFMSRPRDFICSSLTLDLDNTFVKNKEVIAKGSRQGSTYEKYDELADEITKETLTQYIRGYDDKNPYLFPKIFLAVSKNNIDKLIDDKSLIQILHKAIKKAGSNSIYIMNRNKDFSYLSDLNKIDLYPSDALRGKGCILSTSITNFEKNETEYNINSINNQIDEYIDKVREFGNWKKTKLLDKIYPNNFTLLGSLRFSPIQKSYFVIEKPIVSLRFFSLKRIFEQFHAHKNTQEIFNDVNQLFEYISKKINEINRVAGLQLTIGQTSSASSAIVRAIHRYGLDFNKQSLFDTIHSEELENKIHYDETLNKYMNGGMVTRIMVDKNNYSQQQLIKDIKLCFEKNIELINFRDKQFEK